MVTLINKSRVMKVFPLDCAIPLRKGKKHDLSKKEPEKGKKAAKGVQKESERSLTMLPGERRENLPEAVLRSASIKKAIAEKKLLVKMKPVKRAEAKVEAKKAEAQKESKDLSGKDHSQKGKDSKQQGKN